MTDRTALAWGFARVDLGTQGQALRAMIPHINWHADGASLLTFAIRALDIAAGDECVAVLSDDAIEALLPEAGGGNRAALEAMLAAPPDEAVAFKLIALFADGPPRSVEAAYLKLLLLSEGFTPPRTLDLTGIFGLLPNLAWSGNRPYELSWLRAHKIALQMRGGYPHIDYVDKIPRFLQHVVPADNTRIADGGKVRLGAHLAPGTTVLSGAAAINFNAGTLGPSMVEGRISAGVTVGAGTDVGGGASIIGTLSGGNKTVVTIGANCLLGANSVCGIPLGDGCIIDAGVTVLAGSKVRVADGEAAKIDAVNARKISGHGKTVYKGADLSGLNGLHFRLDSAGGGLVAFRSKHDVTLNADLH